MSAGTPLVNGLYPIVRRTRRPYIIQDDDAGPAAALPQVTASPVEGEAAVSYAKPAPAPKAKHAATAPKERTS